MKKLISAISLWAVVQLAHADPIQTAILPAGTASLIVSVPLGQVLQILNFVMDTTSGQATASATIGSSTAAIAKSLLVGGQETHVPFRVAGPATVTVSPPTFGAATISYQIITNRSM